VTEIENFKEWLLCCDKSFDNRLGIGQQGFTLVTQIAENLDSRSFEMAWSLKNEDTAISLEADGIRAKEK
jgi:hypothetical protein